jgi:TolA-binding protein
MKKTAKTLSIGLVLLAGLSAAPLAHAQPAPAADAGGAVRGSLVEDRAAAKLLEAGNARYDADELSKAVEIWESVIERYPRSKVRFDAHMRLGNHLLERERAYDRARTHFEAVTVEQNSDEEQRAEAFLKMGVCFYEARNFGKCFTVMRDVIEKFPVSPQVNQAYYYIGLGHFQLGHYSRAIDALEKVGTTLSGAGGQIEKVEAGKRLFIKIDDADLAALEAGRTVKVRCETTQGDSETIECFTVGRNVRIVLGSMLTALGKPVKDNGRLEVRGDDKVKVTYIDEHTGDRQFNRPLLKEIVVVGDGIVEVTDGAFSESLRGVVLDKGVNIQITDPDRDLTDAADKIKALVEVYREKTQEEIEAETAQLITKGATGTEAPKVDPFKKLDKVEVTFTEAKVSRELPTLPEGENPDGQPTETPAKSQAEVAGDSASTAPAKADASAGEKKDADDGSIHSGVFRATVSLVRNDKPVENDDVLQALPGDIVQITYLDERHTANNEPRTLIAKAKTMDGNLGGVRVTRAQISDQELRIQTQLKTANALTNIGNRYKEFGLKKNADSKYAQALAVCEDVMIDARRLGGKLLEETYVQLWQVYYEMDKLEFAAAMCTRLQREFPNSGFVDDALLQMADVVRKQGNLQRAVGLYSQLVNMQTSQLRGEAQFGIAECYEQMAKDAPEQGSAALYDRAFQEYKKVFDVFPDSGRVGEAVAKMANYYYQQKDYARAVDIFETVLGDHPDAKFLDVILFNYGRCLYRMERKSDARRQFDQLIAEFPESPLASDAKKITEALAKGGF